MDLKRLITHFTYRIEPKADGGFVAHASDPTAPPLEAPTREEMQQKIQANIGAALAAEFPGLKLPLDNKELKFAFHIEHKPGGGFILQSTNSKELPVTGSTQAEIENHFAEKVVGLLGKHIMPELSQALAARLGSGDVKVFVNQTTTFAAGSPKQFPGHAGSIQVEGAQDARFVDSASSAPITPEKSNLGPLFRFLLTLAIIVALMYFFRHR